MRSERIKLCKSLQLVNRTHIIVIMQLYVFARCRSENEKYGDIFPVRIHSGNMGDLFHSVYGSNFLSAPTMSRTDDIYAEESRRRHCDRDLYRFYRFDSEVVRNYSRGASARKLLLTTIYRLEYIGYSAIGCDERNGSVSTITNSLRVLVEIARK